MNFVLLVLQSEVHESKATIKTPRKDKENRLIRDLPQLRGNLQYASSRIF